MLFFAEKIFDRQNRKCKETNDTYSCKLFAEKCKQVSVFERCFIILLQFDVTDVEAKGYEIDSKKNFAKQRNVVLLIQLPADYSKDAGPFDTWA